jgi:hypothetical protein
MSIVIRYPSWRFHATLPAVVVNDEKEDQALGPEWAASPAAFLPPQPEPSSGPHLPGVPYTVPAPEVPGYAPVKYPSWRYSYGKQPVIVNGEEQDRALGPGWTDSPATAAAPAEPVPDDAPAPKKSKK